MISWVQASGTAPSDGHVCFSFRWVMKNNKRSCCGSGWTAVWRRAESWWLFRKAPVAAITRSSPRWWRSGWTATDRSAPAPLYLTAKRRKTTTTSDKYEAGGVGEAVCGGAGLLPTPLLQFFFCFVLFCFPFLTRTNCESLQERRGNHKPPTHLPPLTGDTATLLAHAGTRTKHLKHTSNT